MATTEHKKNARKSAVSRAIMATIGIASMSFYAHAQSAPGETSVYRLKIPVKQNVKVPLWRITGVLHSEWINSGGVTGCAAWSPSPDTVNLYQAFQQTRICQQPQTRTSTAILSNNQNGSTREGDITSESRMLPVAQYQDAIGERDYITGESPGPWSAWSNSAPLQDCTAWSPTAGEVRLYEPFVSTRECQQSQIRSRTVYYVWASGEETPKVAEGEGRSLTVEETYPDVGTRDEIDGIMPMTPSAWSATGSETCDEWSPQTGSQTADFIQTLSCSVTEEQTQDFYHVWVSGAETFSHTETYTRTNTTEQTRAVSVTYSPWNDIPDADESCGSWTPAQPGGRTTDYTQSRDCIRDQLRNRMYQTSGVMISDSPEYQTLNTTETRTNRMTGVVADEWSEWVSTGTALCMEYTPAPGAQTSDYTQTSLCRGPAERNRDTYYTWSYSDRTFHSTEVETGTEEHDDTRNITVTFSGWIDEGVPSCGPWYKYTETTERQDCIQNRTGTYTHTANGTTLHVQEMDGSNSYFNTREAVVAHEEVSYSPWVILKQACGSWAPSADDYYTYETVDQSRSCFESVERTRTTTTYYVDGTEVTASEVEKKGRGMVYTQTVNGTME